MQSSRAQIIAAIKSCKPTHTQLPEIPAFGDQDQNIKEQFKISVKNNKGKCLEGPDSLSLFKNMNDRYGDDNVICSLVEEIKGNLDITAIKDPHELKMVDLAIIKASVGVAENAAMWLTEEALGHRVLPFIAQHLIIVIEEKNLVANMHQAYEKIDINSTGYGVFIAGPSKTADIEQSLVVGAHGARSLTVFLIHNS